MDKPNPKDFGDFDPDEDYDALMKGIDLQLVQLMQGYGAFGPRRRWSGLFPISIALGFMFGFLCLPIMFVLTIVGIRIDFDYFNPFWGVMLGPILMYGLEIRGRYKYRSILKRVIDQKKELENQQRVVWVAKDAKARYGHEVKAWERIQAETREDWWRALKGVRLEYAVADMLRRIGFRTEVTKQSGDGGIDVVARGENQTLLIQCKGWNSKIGVKTVRELLGVRLDSRVKKPVAVLLGTHGFTEEAWNLAKRNRVLLLDARKLSQIAKGEFENYLFNP